MSGDHYKHEDYQHLSKDEWKVLKKMYEQLGEFIVDTTLKLEPAQQRSTIRSYAVNLAVSAPVSSSSSKPMKLNVTPYGGAESENLNYFFSEVEAALIAAQQTNPQVQVAFAMSNLKEKARQWAYGRKQRDPDIFADLVEFKRAIKTAFDPPKNEFRNRSRFLTIRQGRKTLHEYIQLARNYLNGITTNPIDDLTQVVIFLLGLADGPVREQLFREEFTTLEDLFARALEEDFSVKQAQYTSSNQGTRSRPSTPFSASRSRANSHDGPTPMDLSAVSTSPRGRSVNCNRCCKHGHYAYECPTPTAEAAAARARKRRTSPSPARSKNGNHQ